MARAPGSETTEWKVVEVSGHWVRIRPVAGDGEDRYLPRYALPPGTRSGETVLLRRPAGGPERRP